MSAAEVKELVSRARHVSPPLGVSEASTGHISRGHSQQHQFPFQLLSAADLRALPSPNWIIHSVLPREGCAAVFGESTSGKTFLALDMAATCADGRHWFGHKAKPSRWIYVVLEGQAAFRHRVEAWEKFNSSTGELSPITCDSYSIPSS